MLVVIANDLPPAVRGRMKLWFVEPKPNVFISGVKDSVADAVAKLLLDCCPPESGLIIFKRIRKAPGYEIMGLGLPQKRLAMINGLQLIVEKEVPARALDSAAKMAIK